MVLLRRLAPGAVAAVVLLAGCAAAPAQLDDGAWLPQMLQRVNHERAMAGAAPLQPCAALMRSSAGHALDQATWSRMGHTGSDGSTLLERVNAAGLVGWAKLGENVGRYYSGVDQIVDAWMRSPSHRAMLLEPSFDRMGVARAISGSGEVFWAQDFSTGGRCD